MFQIWVCLKIEGMMEKSSLLSYQLIRFRGLLDGDPTTVLQRWLQSN